MCVCARFPGEVMSRQTRRWLEATARTRGRSACGNGLYVALCDRLAAVSFSQPANGSHPSGFVVVG